MSSKAALEPDVVESQVPVVTGLEAQTRGEIDIQIATARRYPRSVSKAIQDAMSLATLNEDIAASCWYAKPQDGKTVEGPSARLAEIMASCWGHMRSEARIVEEGEKYIVARGTSWDLERNVAVAFEVRRSILKRDKSRFSADMVVTASNAANSIAYRNTVFRVIPKAFWWPIYEAARKAAVGTAETLVNKRAKSLEFFAKMGVTESRLFAAIGVRGLDDITLEHLTTLRGLANAIRDGETTIEEAFPVEIKEPQRKSEQQAPPATQAQTTAPVAPAAAAASSTVPQPPTAAAPVPPQQQRGVRVLNTSTIQDEKGNLFEIETTRGVFYTREQGRYDEIATCEGTPTLLVFTWFDAKRQVKGKLVPIKVVDQVALDDQPAAPAADAAEKPEA